MFAILTMRELMLTFSSSMQVGPVSGALPAGIYHLRGENGCGKTSLMRMLAGGIRPTSGRFDVMGEDIWANPHAKRHIGYVPAHPIQPDFWSIEACWRFHAVLRGAPDWPGNSMVNRFGLNAQMLLSHASAGQRRRAELIAALAGDPAVLLLDEVFAYLDTQSVETLCALLEDARQARLILIIAHHELPLAVDASWLMRRGEPLTLERT